MRQANDESEMEEATNERAPLVADAPHTSAKGVCSNEFATGIVFSVACTLSAAAIVYKERGREGAILFGASYLMELSLSIDNMCVDVSSLSAPPASQASDPPV